MAKKRKIPKLRPAIPSHIQHTGLIRRPGITPTDTRVSIEQFVAEQRDQEELSDDDARELVWEMHPDLNRMRLKGKLPEEMIDGDGNVWNPVRHIEMHAIIERQIANDGPAGITELAIRFEQEGKLDSHEVRHALAGAVGEEMWYMMKNNVRFDNERYFESIHRNYDLFVKAKS